MTNNTRPAQLATEILDLLQGEDGKTTMTALTLAMAGYLAAIGADRHPQGINAAGETLNRALRIAIDARRRAAQ